jgi:uncharacterized membrane protein YcaP (DUF421 family)
MDIALRGIVLFAFVFLLTRILGRRELSSLAPFDLVLLIVLGDAIQQGLTQDDYSLTGAMIAVSTIAVLQVTTSYLSYRSRTLRRVFEGEPIILLQDGRLIESNLRRERLTRDEVEEAARQEHIGSLADVKWAVLEASGKMSFIEK